MRLSGWGSRFRQLAGGYRFDRWFDVFSIHLMLVLVIVTVLFLTISPSSDGVIDAAPLGFRAWLDRGGQASPADALAATRGAPLTQRFGTHLSEQPVWMLLDPGVHAGGSPPAPALTASHDSHDYLAFPSRHARSLSCWNAGTLAPLGSAERGATHGALHAAGTGFALRLDAPGAPGAADEPAAVLCRGRYGGPAYLTASRLSRAALVETRLQFERNASLISGGLLTLAVFIFVIALINREWTYIVFAAWLLGNQRLAANALGFDDAWLAHLLPPAWIDLIRQLTFAIYYVVTTSLFVRLFRRELAQLPLRWLLKGVRVGGGVLLLLAFTLPYRWFLPPLWTLAGAGMLVLLLLLGQMLWRVRTRTMIWYAASLSVVLFAILSEVFAAALGTPLLFGGLNPVVTSLAASMLAAFAIAEQQRADRQRRRESESDLRNTYALTPIGLFTLDPAGRFTRANPALLSMLSLAPDAYRTRYWTECFGASAWRRLCELARQGGAGAIEIAGPAAAGTARRRYSVRASFSGGAYQGSIEEVTERAEALERLHFLADHDSLTGALNRRGIERRLASLVGTRARGSVAYVDLEPLKVINDMFGHAAGDEVLCQLVARMTGCLAPRGAIGRIGGDEFVCVFPEIDVDEAAALCEQLAETIGAQPYQIGSRTVRVRASIGVVECLPAMSVHDMIAHADLACRESKRDGTGRIIVYRSDSRDFERRMRDLALIGTLSEEAVPEGLVLAMQPIVSVTHAGEALDFEVLLRLRREDGTLLSAADFIDAVERLGTIGAIDLWVLSSVLAWIERNQATLAKTRFICVNLSGASLNDERIVAEMFRRLEAHASIAHLLCLEITETVALHDLKTSQHFVARAHDMGVRIALDDFGAGHTSFKYLKALSADALKIDGEFVRSMCEHPADIAIVESIVDLARNLGMRTIAEWVEDTRTFEALRAIGVDYVQGYAVGRPVPPEQILAADSALDLVPLDAIRRALAAPAAADAPRDGH
ncbi:putative bifunctional diguanylate cyclase/phosphodiesterase [Burkholderia glumae]|uniref:putative bifunctional diguanylate cyclase/phosphodiesterase n=2 Tax=Burkholderia glumae TaxID=337 RepID=UPI002036F08C|nr:EAL domain-containing protein [Burkholderia glumae]MCM2494691.1 EAL domain-containing protein [Burkholderia glumae]MCM2545561.1 EAL domain-containing protein [Burkholderia glumae]